MFLQRRRRLLPAEVAFDQLVFALRQYVRHDDVRHDGVQLLVIKLMGGLFYLADGVTGDQIKEIGNKTGRDKCINVEKFATGVSDNHWAFTRTETVK